jgi:hypothetical protein
MRLCWQAVVTLRADVRVRSGGTLRIFSSGVATLVVGTHQLRVAAGAQLDLERLVVADSERSSAILSDGMLTASNCTFLRCATATNMVLALAEQFVPDGVGAFLGAAGGAVFSRGVTTMEGCAFLECRAARAKVGCLGGAVFVDTGSHVTLRRSELRRNAAFGGSFMPAGGAIFVWITGQLMLVDSRMNENVVSGGDASTGAAGGALGLAGPGSRASLVGSEVCNNTAHALSGDAFGGAAVMLTGSTLQISGCGNVTRVARATAAASLVGQFTPRERAWPSQTRNLPTTRRRRMAKDGPLAARFRA